MESSKILGIVCCSGTCRCSDLTCFHPRISTHDVALYFHSCAISTNFACLLALDLKTARLHLDDPDVIAGSRPRIAGNSHILFQPITAISSLLDLIGPLPQGRRLFGPTVLESRQPSRNFPIFSSGQSNEVENERAVCLKILASSFNCKHSIRKRTKHRVFNSIKKKHFK